MPPSPISKLHAPFPFARGSSAPSLPVASRSGSQSFEARIHAAIVTGGEGWRCKVFLPFLKQLLLKQIDFRPQNLDKLTSISSMPRNRIDVFS